MEHKIETMILFLCVAVSVMAQTIQNPITPGFYPDPSICRVGSDYYRVNSSFEYFPGVPVFHSKDLVNWEQIGHCLTRKSQFDATGLNPSDGIYAPTIRYHKGTFYMITTLVRNKTYRNFYVTTDDIHSGEWSEPVFVDQSGIDPSLFWDKDDRCYLVSNRGMVYDTNRGIFQSEIDVKTGKRLTEPKKIWNGSGGSYIEGPHMYERNGYYYLLAAEGGTMYGHMVTIARSKQIYGPYESCPYNPILSNRHAYEQLHGTGHGDLVEDENGNWWMVHLGFRTPQVLGRETCLAPVEWNEDGWPVVNKTGTTSLQIENVKNLPFSHPFLSEPVKEEFNTPELAHCWLFLRNPDMACYSLSERKGFMRLYGNHYAIDDLESPTFLGRRQQHFDFIAETCLDFVPLQVKEEAGMLIEMKNDAYFKYTIIRKNGKRILQLVYRLKSLRQTVVEQELPDGIVYMRITGDKELYRFSWSSDGKSYNDSGKLEISFLSAEVMGGYNGVVLGMYASGNGMKSLNPADFDYFLYEKR